MDRRRRKNQESFHPRISTRDNVHTTHLSKEPVRKDGKTRKLGAFFFFPHDPFPRALAPRQPESASCPLFARLAVDDASA